MITNGGVYLFRRSFSVIKATVKVKVIPKFQLKEIDETHFFAYIMDAFAAAEKIRNAIPIHSIFYNMPLVPCI